ncbi:MAG: ABC transporter ATP-binding protein [Actinomycetes bacterium]
MSEATVEVDAALDDADAGAVPATAGPNATPPPDVIRRGLRVLALGARQEPWIFTFAVLGSTLFAAMTVGSAYVLGLVTQRVVIPDISNGHTSAGALAAASAAIVGVSVLKCVGIAGRRIGAGITQFRLQARYRRAVTRQYLRLPLAWHQQHPTGQLLSNANADVEAMWFPIAPTPYAVGSVVMVLITTVSLLLTDWLLTLVGLVVFPIVGYVNGVYARVMNARLTVAQQLRADVSGVAHESFDGALVVKTLGREKEETARFGGVVRRLRDANISVGRVTSAFDPLVQGLPNIGVIIVILAGVVRIRAGALDTGELVRVAYLFTILAFPLQAVAWVLGDLPRAVVGAERVQGVLNATGGLSYGETPPPIVHRPTEVVVSGLQYGYPDDPDGLSVLHEVSFSATAGGTVAIVGATGSGKSTLVNLLVRLVDPNEGHVTFDGVDVRDLTRGGVSQVAALVPQETFLFDDTVRDNVTIGRDVPDTEVWAALELAQADRFVRALPDGLDTMVGERGTVLSGGMRQRLALARALVRRPRLLVLDDATSAVDPRIEQAILAGLKDAGRDDRPATVVIVAHRRATIALADDVVFVDNGRVVARGAHEQLLREQPRYAELVSAYDAAEEERRRVAIDVEDDADSEADAGAAGVSR